MSKSNIISLEALSESSCPPPSVVPISVFPFAAPFSALTITLGSICRFSSLVNVIKGNFLYLSSDPLILHLELRRHHVHEFFVFLYLLVVKLFWSLSTPLVGPICLRTEASTCNTASMRKQTSPRELGRYAANENLRANVSDFISFLSNMNPFSHARSNFQVTIALGILLKTSAKFAMYALGTFAHSSDRYA